MIDYPKAREYLLLASYCGGDGDCTDARPCAECLSMCNIFKVADVAPTFIRALGEPPPATDAGEMRERVARIIDERSWAARERHFERAKYFDRFPGEGTDQLAVAYRQDADAVIKPSLAKADAILALLPAKSYREGLEDACVQFEQAIDEGYTSSPPAHGAKCEHGTSYYEDCISCYDAALTARIAAIRALGEPLPSPSQPVG